ncbi:MAG: DUF5074 domain-containing protein [Bacteroidales bacterium]
MKSNLLKFIIPAFIAISLLSCSKDDPDITILSDGKVIVINQGNYTEQSASISLYDENTKQIQNRVYESANGVSIGATIISGTITSDKEAVLVCNYPDKIIFIDAQTGVDKGTTITDGLVSPRNVVMSSDYIYVTNWGSEYNVNENGYWEFYKSYIAVYDINTKALVKKVLVGTDAEGLTLYGNKLFVAVREGVKVFNVSNINNISLVGTLRDANITGAAKYLAPDRNGMIWVSFPEKGLVQINPATLSVASVVIVPVDNMDGYITCDATGDNILTYKTTFNDQYMAESASIYSVNVTSRNVLELFSGTYFSGVGVSPSTGNIFTAEVSFTSNSVLKVVGTDGTLINSATAGIGTCRYLFL